MQHSTSSSTLRICLLTPYYKSPGLVNSGIGNHFYDLAQGLSNLGHQVHVLFVTKDYHSQAIFTCYTHRDGNVHLHTLKIQLPKWICSKFQDKWAQYSLVYKIFATWKVSEVLKILVKKYSIDVIETTNYDFLALAYLFKITRPPVVTRVSTTLQQISKEDYQFTSRAVQIAAWLEKLMARCSNYLITHTLEHRKLVSKELGIKSERFKIIHHGIDLPKTSDLDRLKEKSNSLNVLYVGRFEYRKGIDILLEAIPQVLKQTRDICFKLVGSDPNDKYQQEFREKWGRIFDGSVYFIGNVESESLNLMYQECDIFIAPSRYESFGLVYVEAMSYGKPVIGSYSGGIPEVVEDGVTGLLAKTGDAVDLANKIIEMASDFHMRQRMGKNARKRVEQFFTKEKMANLTVDNYQDIIHKTKKLTSIFAKN